jgi:hypothetical protein
MSVYMNSQKLNLVTSRDSRCSSQPIPAQRFSRQLKIMHRNNSRGKILPQWRGHVSPEPREVSEIA